MASLYDVDDLHESTCVIVSGIYWMALEFPAMLNEASPSPTNRDVLGWKISDVVQSNFREPI